MTDDKETGIEYIQGEKSATYFTSVPKFIKRMKKLVEQYPKDTELVRENQDGSILVHIPPNWIKQPSPKKKVSEKQIETARENMKEYHKNKKV